MSESDRTKAEPEYRLKLTLEERPPGAAGWYHVETDDRPTHTREAYLHGWTRQQALDGYDQVESMLDSDFVADLVECANECTEADEAFLLLVLPPETTEADEADEATRQESNHS